MTRKTFIWFSLGFSLTVMLLLAIMYVGPMFVSAQGGGNPNADAYQGEQAPSESRTDDPLGRSEVPLLGEAASPARSSNEITVTVPSVLRSDDPLGRNQVPLADIDVSIPNDAAPKDPASMPLGIVSPETEGKLHLNLPGSPQLVPTSPLVIPGADFSSDGVTPANMFFSFWSGYLAGGSSVCVAAPAYLPNGATVYDTFASIYDNEAADYIWLDLLRVDNYTGTVAIMAELATTSPYASTAVTTIEGYPVSYPVVSYPTYSYYAVGCLHTSNIRLYSFRIYYY